jgi:hypothetical protein
MLLDLIGRRARRVGPSTREFNSVFFCLLFLTFNVQAQTTRRVELVFEDDGEPMVAAEFFVGNTRKAITDENGGFVIICTSQETVGYIKYFGVNIHVTVPPTEACNKKLVLRVKPTISLQEITVGSGFSDGTSSRVYSVGELTEAPSFLGQPDILRGLTLRSGISHGQEGNASIFVRGGTPDQNLILLDDAPVYNVNHLGGFMSIFNDDAINSVAVYKTTPPVAYGNRLSSVIDVRLKNGSAKSWRGKAGIGIVSANAFLEGPIIKDKTTIIMGSRIGYFDLINLGIDKSEETDFIDLRMNDFVVKLSHKFSTSHRLFLSTYHSNDVNGFSENTRDVFLNGRVIERQFIRQESKYGNSTFSIRDYVELSNKLQLVTFAYITDYNNTLERNSRNYNPDLIGVESERVHSSFREYGGTSQLKLTSDKYESSVGFSYYRKVVKPLNTSLNGVEVLPNPLQQTSDNYTLFAEHERRLGDRWRFIGAVRLNFYSNGGYSNVFPEIRNRLEYQIKRGDKISLSSNITGQDIHLINSGTLGQSSEAYILASETLPIQSGWQIDAGYAKQVDGLGQFNVGLYYRDMQNVIFYQNNGAGAEAASDILRKTLTSGSGFSCGLETEANLKLGALEANFSYTLSRSRQKFSNFNGGALFPFRYDRPHDISLSLGYPLGAKYKLNTNFIYQSGIAITTPTARGAATQYFPGFNVVPSINNARFPAYHRMDVAITHTWRGRHENENTIRLSIYNAYNRVNPTFYTSSAFSNVSDGEINSITVQTLRVGRFGFLPSIYYAHDFGYKN